MGHGTAYLWERVWSRDAWMDILARFIQNLIRTRMGDAAFALVDWDFHRINGDDLARINIEPSDYPVYDHKGKAENLLAPHPRQHHLCNRPQRTQPHHLPPLEL